MQESLGRWAEYFKEIFEVEGNQPREIEKDWWAIGEDDQEEPPTKIYSRFSRVSLSLIFQTANFRAMEEQYLLRWHCHESTLTKNLPVLLDSNVLTDCAVAAGSKTYKAHKVILAACSPYFLEIFQNIGPLESSIIVLHDVNPEDIEAILSYIYRGQCLVTKQQIPRLVHLSRALKIQGLCNMKIQDNENSVDDFLESNFTNDQSHLK
ncbi:BTB/POZ domain [Popillia japonica]|uniref:BTB/POZ domain n=1 Tax=Popillia japonica TaxID=7064 RepID=A0AAW1M0M6_POPJA